MIVVRYERPIARLDIPVADDVASNHLTNARVNYATPSQRRTCGEERIIFTWKASEPNLPGDSVTEPEISCFTYRFEKLDRSTAGQRPRMDREQLAIEIGDSNPLVTPSGLIDMLGDRRPDEAFIRILGSPGLAADAEDCSNRRCRRKAVAADHDNRRRAVTWDVGAGCVSYQLQVDAC